MKASRGAGAAAVVMVVAALLAASGCDDDRHVTIPATASGTIRGTLADGAPLDVTDVTVRVNSAGNAQPRFESTTRPDSAGNYVMTVPNGPVVVSFSTPCPSRRIYYREDGVTDRPADASIIEVDGAVYRADFACGRITVDLALPPDLPVDRFELGLLEPGDDLDYIPGCSFDADAEGLLHAEFRLVPPGRHLVALGHNSLGSVYLPATFDSTAAEVLTVVAGQGVHHASVLPALARLSGSVTGSWQELAAGIPWVEAWRDDVEVCQDVVTADGRFEISLLLGGPVRLVTWVGGMPGYVGGVDLGSATVFDLEPGEHITGIDRIESALEIEIDGLSAIAPRYVFHIYDGAGHDLTRDPQGYTGGESDRLPLRICNLPPGEVYLCVSPLDPRATWLPQFYDNRDSLAVADALVVPPDGQVGRAAMTLVDGGRISGHVYDGQGDPQPDSFLLEVMRADDPDSAVVSTWSWELVYNRDSGDYTITQLRDGAYKVRGRTFSGTWRYWPDGTDFADAGVVTIEGLGEVTGIDLVLP